MNEQQKTSTIAVLNAALCNANVVKDQIDSLSDDYEMPEVLEQLNETIEAIENELEVLNGSQAA